MWYWLMKFEEMLLVPPFIVYCTLRGIPFFLRCRKCRRWLLEHTYLRSGICEHCHREMLSSNTSEYYTSEYYAKKIERETSPSKRARHLFYRRIVEKVGCGRVLDVGCGEEARTISELQLPHSDLYGMDIVKRAIEIAKNRVNGVNFCIATAENIPYKSNTFDYLICTEVLEHLSIMQGNNTVRECYRVLKSAGKALFTVPNGKGPSGKYDPDHIHLFTFESIVNLLRESGFEVVSGQKFRLYIPFVSRFLELLIWASGRRLPFLPFLDIEVPEFLAMNFLIECQKPARKEG